MWIRRFAVQDAFILGTNASRDQLKSKDTRLVAILGGLGGDSREMSKCVQTN
jgi:hypothetical protein